MAPPTIDPHSNKPSCVPTGLWTAAGIVVLLVASLIGLAVRAHLSPDWETANRAVILQTLNEADMAIVAGDLQTAARKYQEAEVFVSDHMIGDPKLRAAVEGGSIQKRKILALLVDHTKSPPVVESVAIENETRQNTPPGRSFPIDCGISTVSFNVERAGYFASRDVAKHLFFPRCKTSSRAGTCER